MSTTPYMSLVLPTPTVTLGPLYAFENNQAFTVLDAHNHTAGNGQQIPSAGISIDADLSFNSKNATLLRSTRYDDQIAPLALAADVRSIYVVGGNLYYNNGIGQPIQITAGAALNATSIGGIGGDYATSTASVFYTSVNSTFTFWSNTNTTASMDSGPITIRNNVASSFGTTIKAYPTLSADYNLTLPAALPGSTKFLTVDSAGNIGDVYDVDNSTIEVASNVIQLKDGGITDVKINAAADIQGTKLLINSTPGTKLLDASVAGTKITPQTLTIDLMAAMPTGSTVAQDGFAVSASSGSFTSSSTSFVDVFTITITTTGRPVMLQVQSAIASDGRVIANQTGAGVNTAEVRFAFNRAGFGDVCIHDLGLTATKPAGTLYVVTPPSSLGCFDYTILGTPGTYTYTVRAAVTGGSVVQVIDCILLAYEI